MNAQLYKSVMSDLLNDWFRAKKENGDTLGQVKVLTSQKKDSFEDLNKQIEHPEWLIDKTSTLLLS